MREGLLTLAPALRPHWERLRSSPLGYRLARGAFWSLIGAFLSRGLGLAASIVVARILGKEAFGELSIIQSTAGMFGVVAGFGLGLTATKYVAEFRQEDPNRAGRILSLSAVVSWGTGLLCACVLVALAPALAAKTLAAQHLTPELRVGGLLVLLGAVNGAQTGALAGFERFKTISLNGFLVGMAHFPCLALGCWLYGLEGAVWGLVLSSTISCALNRRALGREAGRQGIALWSSKWLQELPILWKFSLPAVLASLLVNPMLWFCQALLVREPGGYQGMAEYSVGVQWGSFVQYLPALLCTAYLPVAASIGPQDVRRKRRLMVATSGLSAGVSGCVALVVFLGSSLILGAYGPGFVDAKWILALMVLTGVFQSVNTVLVQTIMAGDQAWLRLISNTLWAVLLVGASFTLVPRFGALGLALACLLAQAAHICLQIPLALLAVKRV